MIELIARQDILKIILEGIILFIGVGKTDIPGITKQLLAHFCTKSFYIESSDPLYHTVFEWMGRNIKAINNVNSFAVSTKSNKLVQNNLEERLGSVLYTPSIGKHYFIRNGRPAWIERGGVGSKKDDDAPSSLKSSYNVGCNYIRIGVLGFRKKAIEDLLEDIIREDVKRAMEVKVEESTVINIFYPDRSGLGWDCRACVRKRSLKSVYLKEGMMNSIISDVKRFYDSSDRYTRNHIPFHRGLLFYGPPGSGKTTVVMAIASELNNSIFIINLADRKIDDNSLMSLLSNVKENGVVLFEDIDCVFDGRSVTGESKISFSTVLNALDGICAKEGILVCMTTNHREKLDPALLRPGRIDQTYYLGVPGISEVKQAARSFYPEAKEVDLHDYAEKVVDMAWSMSMVQGNLILGLYENDFLICKAKCDEEYLSMSSDHSSTVVRQPDMDIGHNRHIYTEADGYWDGDKDVVYAYQKPSQFIGGIS